MTSPFTQQRSRRYALSTLICCGASLTLLSQEGSRQVEPATAVVSGVVVSDDREPLPIAEAVVTIWTFPGDTPVVAVTTADGRFEVPHLPPGHARVSVSRHGYVTTGYGGIRRGADGVTLELSAGQVNDVVVRLQRAATVTGVITEPNGDPLPEVLVFASDAHSADVSVLPSFGRDRRTPLGITDHLGRYRLFDLAPGEYVLLAFSTKHTGPGGIEAPSERELDDAFRALERRRQASLPSLAPAPVSRFRPSVRAIAPTFYPGTTRRRDAVKVVLGRGEERTGVDFVMAPAVVASIEGAILGSGLSHGIELSISSIDGIGAVALSSARPVLSEPPDERGRFRFSNVLPGTYTIVARGGLNVRPSEGVVVPHGEAYGVAEVEVDGLDLKDVSVVMHRAPVVAGRVRVDAQSGAGVDLAEFRLAIEPVARGPSGTVAGVTRVGSAFATTRTVTVDPDGRFDLGPVAPGRYALRYIPPMHSDRWWLRSALLEERDILDTCLLVTPGSPDVSLILTLSDRHSELTGMLQMSTGQPVSGYDIVVFPAASELRQCGTRRMRSARLAADGVFRFTDLPAGRYLIVALPDAGLQEWRDARFLEAIAPSAVPVEVRDGERTEQNLELRVRAPSHGYRFQP